MCTSCNIRTVETDLTGSAQELTVSPDSDRISIDYPVSWVSHLVVTSQADPYGSPLFDSSGRNVTDVGSVLKVGMYVGKARIGTDSYGSTDCAVIVRADGSEPIVRVFQFRPDFYR